MSKNNDRREYEPDKHVLVKINEAEGIKYFFVRELISHTIMSVDCHVAHFVFALILDSFLVQLFGNDVVVRRPLFLVKGVNQILALWVPECKYRRTPFVSHIPEADDARDQTQNNEYRRVHTALPVAL